MDTSTPIESTNASIALNEHALYYLNVTRKWSKFLSIMGFIGTGIIVLLALFIGSIMHLVQSMAPAPFPFPTSVFSFIYLLIALIYFFPSLYLYRFSDKMETALLQKDETVLAQSFENLKSVFKFMGIMTIVVLSLYLLIIICVILAALFMGH